jgi:hypothetical protein
MQVVQDRNGNISSWIRIGGTRFIVWNSRKIKRWSIETENTSPTLHLHAVAYETFGHKFLVITSQIASDSSNIVHRLLSHWNKTINENWCLLYLR